MAYLASSQSSFAAALTSIASEIQSNTSWGVTANTVDGSGNNVILEHSITGETVSLKSGVQDTSINADANNNINTGIGIYAGTGYSAGGGNWQAKVTGGPTGGTGSSPAWASMSFGNLPDTTVNYFVFTNGDLVWIVLRVGSYYQHACFGQMDKVGTWTGGFCFGATVSGQYLDFDGGGGRANRGALGFHPNVEDTSNQTTPPNFYVRSTVPGGANNWIGQGSDLLSPQVQEHSGAFAREPARTLMGHTPNLSTSNAFLIGLQYEWFDPTLSNFRHIANLPSVFIASLYALNAEEQFVIGGKTYQIFPFIRRLAITGTGFTNKSFISLNPFSELTSPALNTGAWGYAIERTA